MYDTLDRLGILDLTPLDQVDRRFALATLLGASSIAQAVSSDSIPVDSHQHFWSRSELLLPPPPPREAVLGKDYLPRHLQPELKKAGVGFTVLVQGFPQTPKGNRWLFHQANRTDFVAGVVAWVELRNRRRTAQMLMDLASEPKFCGLRHIAENEPNPAWMSEERVLEGLRAIAERDLPFDILAKPVNLPHVLRALDKFPTLRAVLDHMGKPNIIEGDRREWTVLLRELAARPNVFCKISGLVTEAHWRSWRVQDLQPYVDLCIEAFGWDRIMFGSDWPVCLLAGTYQQVTQAARATLSAGSADQVVKAFGENAKTFYRLKIDTRL